MSFLEQDIIEQVALIERSIPGIKQSYGYSQNPDNIVGLMPCVLHYIPSVKITPRALHNIWANQVNLTSIVTVTSRQVQGGRLKYLENAAIPYMQAWRTAFQDNTNLTNLLAATGSVKCFLTNLSYGAGGQLLTVGGIETIGVIASFVFLNA